MYHIVIIDLGEEDSADDGPLLVGGAHGEVFTVLIISRVSIV